MNKRATLYKYTWFNKWFCIKLAILSVFWFMAYQCFEVVKNIEPLKDFVPHEILGVA